MAMNVKYAVKTYYLTNAQYTTTYLVFSKKDFKWRYADEAERLLKED